MDQTKTQADAIPPPDGLPDSIVVSPDTRRANRIPPGQSRTKKWPILDASGPPPIDLAAWRFGLRGLVSQPMEWSWTDFGALPRVQVFSDFHCVTRWSRLGNVWEGVSVKTLLELAGGALPNAAYALIHGYDSGWTTNVAFDELLADDALIATKHDGEPLTAEHGGPARLILPRLYAWKSAKWVAAIELLDKNRAGFWERNGYHMNGDPWKEERYGY